MRRFLFGLAFLCVAAQARGDLIDFEVLSNDTPLPTDQYQAQGVLIYGAKIYEVFNFGIDYAVSGSRVLGFAGAMSPIDGADPLAVANAHGQPPAYYGAGLVDFVFVVPGTTIPTTFDTISLFMGGDSLGLLSGENNRIIVEGFDLENNRIIDYVSPLLNVPFVFQQFDVAGVHRLRITQVDGVVMDDLSFSIRPVPEPGSLAMLAIGGIALACYARRRKLRPGCD